MSKIFLRSEHNYDRDLVSRETGLVCEEASKTVVSEADDTDINVIVRRFGLGVPMPQAVRMPLSGDFTGISSFHEANNVLIAAQGAFESFPAEVRKRFHFDPGELIAFVEDVNNRDEAIKLGLVLPPKAVVDAGAVADASTA